MPPCIPPPFIITFLDYVLFSFSLYAPFFFYFFFFQAEDGIRDKLVTGVQTCALPISRADRQGFVFRRQVEQHNHALPRHHVTAARGIDVPVLLHLGEVAVHSRGDEIGRASCRERV